MNSKIEKYKVNIGKEYLEKLYVFFSNNQDFRDFFTKAKNSSDNNKLESFSCKLRDNLTLELIPENELALTGVLKRSVSLKVNDTIIATVKDFSGLLYIHTYYSKDDDKHIKIKLETQGTNLFYSHLECDILNNFVKRSITYDAFNDYINFCDFENQEEVAELITISIMILKDIEPLQYPKELCDIIKNIIDKLDYWESIEINSYSNRDTDGIYYRLILRFLDFSESFLKKQQSKWAKYSIVNLYEQYLLLL